MIDTTTTTADGPFRAQEKRGCGMSKKPWSFPEIATVVGGFIVFWPLGLVALGLKFWKGEIWQGASEMSSPWKKKDWGQWKGPQGFSSSWHPRHSTGNAAFDDYRRETLERLEAERRKLEETQREFADHLSKLRKAKDKEEFDRFMSERNAVKPQAE